MSVVPPDEAAGGCAEHAMVARKVTGRTADNGSLKAAGADRYTVLLECVR